MGRCPACEEWDSLVEEAAGGIASTTIGVPIPLNEVPSDPSARLASGWGELDRVLGGGIVPGSLVLLAGEPGTGKSTLALSLADRLSPLNVLYVAGEESVRQIRMRADRLGVDSGRIQLFAETDVTRVESAIRATEPDLVVVDSIQSMYSPEVPSGPGSVIQTRSCTVTLMRVAKELEIPIVIIGHVTKDGAIAGPKVLEHAVDAVIQFEGDRHHAFRILRAVKNRFGSCSEIGVFEMGPAGLTEVKNPSERFLSCRRRDVSGSVVICTVEGTRPVLLEMQALVSQRTYGMPQRTVTGFDLRRLQMLLAVLGRRANIRLSDRDVFVNAVAGARIDEPAADAGVVAALASAARDKPVPDDLVVIGEVGLGGELRTVSRIEQRLAEAARLGFRRAVVPGDAAEQRRDGLEILPASDISVLLDRIR
jgi:DNA repair protein RadA/Sms